MARPSYRLTNLPVAALSLTAMGLGAAAFSFGGSDAVVERGFERAFASLADQTSQGQTGQGQGADLISTTGEQLHVSRAVHDPAAVFAKPVVVGDRITITSGGRERTLHVVKIDQLDSSIAPASSANPAPLLLVTCSDDGNPKARPVRFLIEADETLPAVSTATGARIL